jgi:hypothetical protein
MTSIRESAYTYPVIMSIHLTCIALFGGLIVITDLRLLGCVLNSRPIADVVNGLRWWKRLGFVIMASMGLLLAGSKALTYYPNPYFWLKMSLLGLVSLHAVVSRPRVYNHPELLAASPETPRRAKIAGGLSLVLWSSVLCAGRMIGYYEDPSETGQVSRSTEQPIAAAPATFLPGVARAHAPGTVKPSY